MDIFYPEHMPQLHVAVLPDKVCAVVAPGPVGYRPLFGDVRNGALYHPDGFGRFAVLSLLHIEAGQRLSLEGADTIELLIGELAQLLGEYLLKALGLFLRSSTYCIVVALYGLPSHIVAMIEAE